MDEFDLAGALRATALLSAAGLCLAVCLVGAVAVVAELAGTWTWLFRMEQVSSMAVPVVLTLLATTFAASVGVVFTAGTGAEADADTGAD